MTEVERINKWLADRYGTSIDGKTLYRVVWSDKLLEHRYGTYTDFSESGLYLRTITETRLTRKYNYIHERWVFEKWAPGQLTQNRETPDALNGDYIPVYVFEDKDRNYLPPIMKAVVFIIQTLEGQVKRDDPGDMKYFEESQDHQVETMLDDHPSFRTSGPTRDSVAYGNRIVYPKGF